MSSHVALLRGINVGGARKLPMKELRAMLEGLGYADVRTYIASGNAVFGAKGGRHEARIREAIAERFGYDDVPVLVRTAEQLRAIHRANPYDEPDADPKKVYVAFLAKKPTKKAVAALEGFDRGDNELVITPAAVYLSYAEGMGRSKLNHGLLERRLGVDVTMRNLRTVRKLVEMVG